MYTEKVMDHFRNPRNVGIIENPDAVGEVGNPTDGDMMKIYLKIDENHVISDVKFQTFGCVAAIASSSMVTEMAKGNNILEAEKISRNDVADALGGLPPIKMQCSNLGADALQKAIRNYRKKHFKSNSHPIKSPENPDNYVKNPDLELDLREYQCPLTFVHTKIALEEMESNQVIKIILDFYAAFSNVPNSVQNQNLGEILKESEKNGEKTIWIKKI